MQDLSIDPVVGSEILDILGIAPHQLDNPRMYSKIHSVVKYFAGKTNTRQELLRVLQRSGREDKLDAAWMFVSLREDRERALRTLDPKDFDDDVAKEIADGYLTKNKIERIKSDIATRKQRKEREDQAHAEARMVATAERKVAKAVAAYEPKYDEIAASIEQIETVNAILQRYE